MNMTIGQIEDMERFRHRTGLRGAALKSAYAKQVKANETPSPIGNPMDATIAHSEAMPGKAKRLPFNWYAYFFIPKCPCTSESDCLERHRGDARYKVRCIRHGGTAPA